MSVGVFTGQFFQLFCLFEIFHNKMLGENPSFNINSPITFPLHSWPQNSGGRQLFQDISKQKKTNSFQSTLKTITVWMVNGLWHQLNIIFHYFPAQSTQMTHCLRLQAHSFKAYSNCVKNTRKGHFKGKGFRRLVASSSSGCCEHSVSYCVQCPFTKWVPRK